MTAPLFLRTVPLALALLLAASAARADDPPTNSMEPGPSGMPRQNVGFAIAGGVVLELGYDLAMATSGIASLADTAANATMCVLTPPPAGTACPGPPDRGGGLLFIPIAGPWIALGHSDAISPPFLVIDGVVEALGVGMLIAGALPVWRLDNTMASRFAVLPSPHGLAVRFVWF